jgi:Spy/CpxP family protein refolding chaperone
MKNAKAIAGVVLVFVLGAVCGGVGTYLVQRSKMDHFISGGPAAREELLIKRLSDRLALDDRQLEQIRPIVHETHEAIRRVRQQSRPQVEALINDSQRRISALLRPDQQEKFERLMAERRAHGHQGAPPPPP